MKYLALTEKYRLIHLNQETRFNTQYLSETTSNNQQTLISAQKHVILFFFLASRDTWRDVT